MADIWELRPEERERALAQGYTEEQVDVYQAARRANWNAIKDNFRAGLSDEEFAVYYQQRYGIDHHCTCAEDTFLQNFVTKPACMLNFHEAVVNKLEEVLPERDYLQNAVDSLRMQVAELGESPRV